MVDLDMEIALYKNYFIIAIVCACPKAWGIGNLHLGVGPYFAVKGLNFFRYFAFRWERGEISLKFQNFLRAHMRTVPCIQLPYLSISLTRFPSQNEVPRFVPL